MLVAMSANFLRPSATQQTAPPAGRSLSQTEWRSRNHEIDWHAARQANRACCCSARPMVIAVMPLTVNRPHHTDLLLCWHHYRVFKDGLRAAGAELLDIDGAQITNGDWPQIRASG